MSPAPKMPVMLMLLLCLTVLCASTLDAADLGTVPKGDCPPRRGVLRARGQSPLGTVPLATADKDAAEEPREVSLWTTVQAGGFIGLLIILVSMAAIALIVEHFLSMRRDRFIPPLLEQRLEMLLQNKQYPAAREVCTADDSFLARVVGAGLSQIGAMFGFFDMQSAMQEVSEREISKLYRKLEYLSFIAATAPMLGLLGTVTGMIRSFNKIAATRGTAKPYQLAGGISEALVTTCMGLIVAIPCMFFVSLFRSRIDGYVAETESVVEKLIGRFRKTSA